MLRTKKIIIIIFFLLIFGAVLFTVIDWSVDGFDFLKPQDYQFYFQSWISVAGLIFSG